LKQNASLACFISEQLEFNMENNNWDLETTGKALKKTISECG
jgi:hypothetical protein